MNLFNYPLSSIPGNNTIAFESNETLNAAATRAATQSSIAVTRTSGSALSIANGASSSAIQYLRFNPKTRFVTTALTLTIASGTGTGKVDIYAYLKADGSLGWWVSDTSGNTFTFTSQTVKTAPGAQPPLGALLVYSWTITTGAYDVSGGTDQGLSTDCWIDQITLSNVTAGAVTYTITDNQTTPVNLAKAVSLAANSTAVYSFPGGRFFESGVLLTAGAANSIDVGIRGTRLRRNQLNP